MTTLNVALDEAPTKAVLALDARGAKLHLLSYHRARKAGLTPSGELALYALLTLRALKNERDWTQTASSVLAAELDVSERTVTRWLRALAKAGWIARRAVARSDGTLQVARTRMPALDRHTTASNRVTEISQAAIGQGREPPIADAEEILSTLSGRTDFQRISDRGLRDRLAAEIVWSATACALARLPTRALALNVALKKIREKQWRTPRTMPSDYPAQLARRLPHHFHRAHPEGTAPTFHAPVAATTPDIRTRSVGARFLADLARQLDHKTDVSGNSLLLATYQEAGFCTTHTIAARQVSEPLP